MLNLENKKMIGLAGNALTRINNQKIEIVQNVQNVKFHTFFMNATLVCKIIKM